MKRNVAWVLVVAVVGITCWNLGRSAGRTIEFRIEVDDSGVRLVSTKGCGWRSAGISGGGDSFVFVVSDDEVHAVGHEVVLR